MPQDKNGTKFKIGDKVILHCMIQSIQPRFEGAEDPCDVILAIDDEPSPGAPKTQVKVRGRQIEVIGAADTPKPRHRVRGRGK